MTPMLDFDTAYGVAPDHHEFVDVAAGCIFNVGFDRSEVPELAVVGNPNEEPITLDIIAINRLFRDAPEDIVAALFERAYIADEYTLYRVAAPDMTTGDLVYRVNTFCDVLEDRHEAVWSYVVAKAQFYSHRVTIAPGDSFAIDNRRQVLRFPADTRAELSFAYDELTLAGDPAEETDR